MLAALKNPAFRDDAYRFARWAAYVAGGPDGDLGAAFAPVVGLLADAALWTAAGDDAVRLLGEIDHPSARDRLVAELERPQKDTTLDAIIHALARQGEPRPRTRVVALGQEAVAARSGNLTYEQASRIGAVAFYLLALDSGSRAEGLPDAAGRWRPTLRPTPPHGRRRPGANVRFAVLPIARPPNGRARRWWRSWTG